MQRLRAYLVGWQGQDESKLKVEMEDRREGGSVVRVMREGKEVARCNRQRHAYCECETCPN